MSIFDELFNPSARFREEEKRRLEWMRDEEGEGDPYRGPIDLDSGAVRIKLPGSGADDPAPITAEVTTAEASPTEPAAHAEAASAEPA